MSSVLILQGRNYKNNFRTLKSDIYKFSILCAYAMYEIIMWYPQIKKNIIAEFLSFLFN